MHQFSQHPSSPTSAETGKPHKSVFSQSGKIESRISVANLPKPKEAKAAASPHCRDGAGQSPLLL